MAQRIRAVEEERVRGSQVLLKLEKADCGVPWVCSSPTSSGSFFLEMLVLLNEGPEW